MTIESEIQAVTNTYDANKLLDLYRSNPCCWFLYKKLSEKLAADPDYKPGELTPEERETLKEQAPGIAKWLVTGLRDKNTNA